MTKKLQEDYHKVSQRVHFSKYFKRRALIEFARLKKPNEALIACGFDLEKELVKDKKYAAKLLHKWRKELYNNNQIMSFMNFDLTDEVIKNELMYVSNGLEGDRVMKLMGPKIEEYVRRKKDKAQFIRELKEEFGDNYKP